MSFPKTAAIKGGKAPASESQKQAARECARTHTPWKSSTGPRSITGKIISRFNGIKPGIFKRWAADWKDEGFEAGCAAAEGAIEAFKADLMQHRGCYHSFEIKLYQNPRHEPDWRLYVLYITFIGYEQETKPRIERAMQIQNEFGSEGRMQFSELLYADDPRLQVMFNTFAQSEISMLNAKTR